MSIKWIESLELGIPAIDDEHRRFWSLCADLECAVAAGRPDHVRTLTNAALLHSKIHFRREEQELMRVGYADARPAEFGRHVDEHRRLLAVIEARLGNETGEPVMTAVQFVRAELIEHMLRTDLLYKEFVLAAAAAE